jgi:hypothetical protein
MSSESSSGRTTASANPFVFYDPYYEELVRRKRIYESKESADVSKSRTSHREDFEHESIRCEPVYPLKFHLGVPQPSVSESWVPDRNSDDKNALTERISSLEGELAEAKAQIKAHERVISSLYSDIDRAKASLTECMERESRFSKELVHLKRAETVSVSDFKELEGKYLNAVGLIDELNWKLHKFPPDNSF